MLLISLKPNAIEPSLLRYGLIFALNWITSCFKKFWYIFSEETQICSKILLPILTFVRQILDGLFGLYNEYISYWEIIPMQLTHLLLSLLNLTRFLSLFFFHRFILVMTNYSLLKIQLFFDTYLLQVVSFQKYNK